MCVGVCRGVAEYIRNLRLSAMVHTYYILNDWRDWGKFIIISRMKWTYIHMCMCYIIYVCKFLSSQCLSLYVNTYIHICTYVCIPTDLHMHAGKRADAPAASCSKQDQGGQGPVHPEGQRAVTERED